MWNEVTQMNPKAVKGTQIVEFSEELNMDRKGRKREDDFQVLVWVKLMDGGAVIKVKKQERI